MSFDATLTGLVPIDVGAGGIQGFQYAGTATSTWRSIIPTSLPGLLSVIPSEATAVLYQVTQVTTFRFSEASVALIVNGQVGISLPASRGLLLGSASLMRSVVIYNNTAVSIFSFQFFKGATTGEMIRIL